MFNSSRIFAFLLVLLLGIGGLVVYFGHNLFNLLESDYDAKASAVMSLKECFKEPIDDTPILLSPWCDRIQYEIAQSHDKFSMKVVYFNQENEICCRGGDEVGIQVTLSNGKWLGVIWYEGQLVNVIAPARYLGPVQSGNTN